MRKIVISSDDMDLAMRGGEKINEQRNGSARGITMCAFQCR